MGIESSVGQAKYLKKKAPTMKMRTIDARMRLKMNKRFKSQEFGDIEMQISPSVLRKSAREFKNEMIDREKITMSKMLEKSTCSVLFEHESSEQKLLKKAELLKTDPILSVDKVMEEISILRENNKRSNGKVETFIKKQLSLRSTILNQERVYFTKNKTKVPVSSLLESLRRLCTEKLPADANFVLDIMEINGDSLLLGKQYEETGFRENGSRFVEKNFATADDVLHKHIIIAKWSIGNLTFVN